MKRNLFFGTIGLLIGLIAGFFVANRIADTTGVGTVAAPFQPGTSSQVPQVDSKVVKDQSNQDAMMPEVTAKLKKAADEPENFDAQIAAADMFIKIRNYAKAVDYYEAADQLKPNQHQLIVTIGNTYFDSGQFEKAEVWYLKALEQQPVDVNVRTDLGITFVERDKPDIERAISEFQKSLETDPNHGPTLFNLSVAYYKKGDMAAVQNIASRLEKVDPQGELYRKLKQVLK